MLLAFATTLGRKSLRKPPTRFGLGTVCANPDRWGFMRDELPAMLPRRREI